MDTWSLHFDGACEPNNPGGIATYGFILAWGEKTHPGKGLAAAPGTAEATNNVAEYMGLQKGLDLAQTLLKRGDQLYIMGDSQLVIRQVEGQYATNAPHLKPLNAKASLTIFNLRMAGITIGLKWIPRELNGKADALSKEAVKDAVKADPEILSKIVLKGGKHAGKKLSEVPSDYYRWLWTNKGGEILVPQKGHA